MRYLEALPMHTKIKLLLIALISLLMAVTMRVWDYNLELAEAKIEAVKLAETQCHTEAPVNRVELLRATYPDDWQPVYVYSEPGRICYPEVIERNLKQEKAREEWAFQVWLGERYG